MVFQLSTSIRDDLLQEVNLQTATQNSHYRVFMLTLEGDDYGTKIQTLAYYCSLLDVFKVHIALQEHLPRRELGTEPRNIGLLPRSN
jgi:hypothetical protein